MILPVHARVRSRLTEVLTATFGLEPSAQPPIVIETPPRRTLGDLAVPVAFELARRLRKAPRVIAQELTAAVGPIEGVARIDAAGTIEVVVCSQHRRPNFPVITDQDIAAGLDDGGCVCADATLH